MGVDFQPAESTDVDIILKVKEKQIGTASAGAGYSSDGGLTGFVELGHNNVFGNGQAVTLQLERGSSRRARRPVASPIRGSATRRRWSAAAPTTPSAT